MENRTALDTYRKHDIINVVRLIPRSQSQVLSESFPAKKLRMGFERKTASEGAGIGANDRGRERTSLCRSRAIQTWNQNWRVREMSRPQDEDDGSVLKYVTEDEPQRARQIARYTILEFGGEGITLQAKLTSTNKL